MLAELATAVHTTGINLASVSTIAGTILGSVGGAAKYVVSRVERSRVRAQEANEKFVTELVGAVTKLVDLRLAQVNNHLADQDRKQETLSAQVLDVRDRTGRIEGRLSATRTARRE